MRSFSQKVYQATSKIPKGQVRSYSWIAFQIGSPKAVRAVGQALKRNPTPITVPCHRVIRKDGSLGGFAGGLKKKIRLLRKECVLVERGRVRTRKLEKLNGKEIGL